MILNKHILLIMNCKKYRNKALYQKKEWLSNLPKEILYFHVIGDETLDDEFKFDEEKRILWLRVEDDYCSLPKKVINAYDAISKTYEFEYIFKTDDDQILLNPHFFNIIINILNKKTPMAHYGGFIVDVQQPYLSQYHRIHNELPKNIPIKVTKYCNGRFYCLSKDAVNDLTKKKELIWKNCLEDYAIGYHLDTKFKDNLLSIKTDEIFKDIENTDFDPSEFKEVDY